MKQGQKGDTALRVIISVVVAMTVGVVGWVFAKNSLTPVQQTVTTQLTKINQTQPITQADTSSENFRDVVNTMTQFDACGKIEKYKNESWYPDIIDKLQEVKQPLGGIWEACQSLDKSIVIVLTNGGGEEGLNSYCEAGSLYQYGIVERILVRATFDDKGRGCVSWPSDFGKRSGGLIELRGSGGDAGCGNTMYYSYNYIDNKMQLIKECSKCEGESKDTCSNY